MLTWQAEYQGLPWRPTCIRARAGLKGEAIASDNSGKKIGSQLGYGGMLGLRVYSSHGGPLLPLLRGTCGEPVRRPRTQARYDPVR